MVLLLSFLAGERETLFIRSGKLVEQLLAIRRVHDILHRAPVSIRYPCRPAKVIGVIVKSMIACVYHAGDEAEVIAVSSVQIYARR